MRTILLATTLVALAPFAIAQTYPPGSTTLGPSHGTTYSPNGSEPSVSAPDTSRSAMNQAPRGQQAQPDSNNCGTPDEPKACPPLPRRPLAGYPPNRHD